MAETREEQIRAMVKAGTLSKAEGEAILATGVKKAATPPKAPHKDVRFISRRVDKGPDGQVTTSLTGPDGKEYGAPKGGILPQGHDWIRREFDLRRPGEYEDFELGPNKEAKSLGKGFQYQPTHEGIAKSLADEDKAAEEQSRYEAASTRLTTQDARQENRDNAALEVQRNTLSVQTKQLNAQELAVQQTEAHRIRTENYQKERDLLADDIRNKKIPVEDAMNQLAKFRDILTAETHRDANRLQAAMLGVTQRGQDVQAATSRRGQDIGYGEAAMSNFTNMAKDIMSRDVSPSELANLNAMMTAGSKPGRWRDSGFQWQPLQPAQPRFSPSDAVDAGAQGIRQAQANASSAMPGQVQIPGESAGVGAAMANVQGVNIPTQQPSVVRPQPQQSVPFGVLPLAGSANAQ